MPLQLPKCDRCGEVEVQWTCTQCDESYCNQCDQNRHDSKKSKEHKRYPYSEVQGISNRCKVQGHEEYQLSLYCAPCSKLVCASCIIKDHKNHSVTDFKSVIENVKSSLLQRQTLMKQEITKREEKKLKR